MSSNLSYELECNGSVTLRNILATYNAPINEDHAWALCHQCVQFLISVPPSCILEHNSGCMPLSPDLELIKIHRDGQVTLKVSILEEITKEYLDNECYHFGCMTLSQAISKVAVIIYKALDYGIPEDEERSLGLELERLLDMMVSADEPINGHSSKIGFNAGDILKACNIHWEYLKSNNKSTSFDQSAIFFYRNTCKSLVADAIEFSKFVNIAAQATKALQTLCEDSDPDNFSDGHSLCLKYVPMLTSHKSFKAVAKLWIKVLQELREGVKLKKLKVNDASVEERQGTHQKTPYEVLMDDIKVQNFHLRKVPDKEIAKSNSTPDLHDIVMQYIRSRPKLKKASARVVKPLVRTTNPFEDLMNSIREAHFQLRPVKNLLEKRKVLNME